MNKSGPDDRQTLTDDEVRIWITNCNYEPARQALRELLAFRVRGVANDLESYAQALATARAQGRRAGMEKAAGMCRVEAKACQDAGESFVQSISDDWRDVGSMHIQAGLALDKIAAAILAAAEDTP